MASSSFVLDGQGIPATTTPATAAAALDDAQHPLAQAVLLSCLNAYNSEFSSLSTEEKDESGIAHLENKDDLLQLAVHHPTNAVVANIYLFLIQILRWIATENPFSFQKPTISNAGILGFSTGIFAASVIATAHDVPSLIAYATETFRVAFWLGLRAQQYANKHPIQKDSDSSWSLVTFGSSRSEIQDAVDKFNAENTSVAKLHLTAVTHSTCISVSSHPAALALFRASYLPATTFTSRYAPIYTLYHATELQEVKENTIRDVSRRNIRYPGYEHLWRGLRSTLDGQIIPSSGEGRKEGYTLVEEIIDMTLLHPVNWDAILSSLSSIDESSLRLVNLGPGNLLWRSTSKSLPSSISLDLVDASPKPVEPKERKPTQEDIAIVGMAVQFPGGDLLAGDNIEGTDALWGVLENGLNTVREIPSERFDVKFYNDNAKPGAKNKRAMKAHTGNFLPTSLLASFDTAFFRVSPREARSMDPQQRLLLETSYHALEDAGWAGGYSVPMGTQWGVAHGHASCSSHGGAEQEGEAVWDGPSSWDPRKVGVYVGVATNDYVQNLRKDVDVYYSTGTLHAFLSGKISYAFGFSGPSVVIDTACSSSMVSLYHACRALQTHDITTAIAGGVNAIGSPDMYIGLDRAHFLSPTGQCKPWDASADGYSRAEGCGMFVVKRLSDALAENDKILGVIRGIEVNQSAEAESITHPHIGTQVELFARLMERSGVPPAEVDVVEAHGTGTRAGDPTELTSLRRIFAQGTNRSTENPLHLTSVKANIGHAEAASGAASLAKLLLMLKHEKIPKVISLKNLNPDIPDLSKDGCVVDTVDTVWKAKEGKRRTAMLNNFGAAGSNCALLIQEAPSAPVRESTQGSTHVVLALSAETESSAETQRKAYISHLNNLSSSSVQDIQDLAYTTTARRRTFRYRLAVSGSSPSSLASALQSAQVVQVCEGEQPKVVFVFSGQGGQYLGMSKALYNGLARYRAVVDECDEKLKGWGYGGVKRIICHEGSEGEGDFREYQVAVVVLELALAACWKAWGVEPNAVTGHSLGEYAALVVAGVLSVDDALKIVAGRAQLMKDHCEPNKSGMLAVKMVSVKLEGVISGAGYDNLSIACYNSSADCVVAGDITQLEALQKSLKAEGTKCARVNVPYGYHTTYMSPILPSLTALVADNVTLRPPTIPILSNVHGTVVQPGDASVFTPEYFARHCGEPVQFDKSVQELCARSDFSTIGVWLEVGPHPTSLPMLRSIPSTSDRALYLPSLKKNSEDWAMLGAALASLYHLPGCGGLKWRKVWEDIAPTARVAEVPRYPFVRDKQFWVSFTEDAPAAPAAQEKKEEKKEPEGTPTRFSLLSLAKRFPNQVGQNGKADAAVFDTSISALAKLIEGHKVQGYGLCPASVYVEAASGGAELLLQHLGRWKDDQVVTHSDITFSNPLVYDPAVPRTVRISVWLTPEQRYTGKWEVSSYVGDESKAAPHCAGRFSLTTGSALSGKLSLSSTMIERRMSAVQKGVPGKPAETLYTRTAYDVVFSRIVAYSPTYHTMKSITIDPNGVDAYAHIQLPSTTTGYLPQHAFQGTFVTHPVFSDTLLHAAGFVINILAGNNEAFICASVDRVRLVPSQISTEKEYGVYVNVGYADGTVAVADAWAVEMGGEGKVVGYMKRMKFRKLRMSGFKTILGAAAGSSTHAPARVSSPPRKALAPAPVQQQQQVVVKTQGVSIEQVKEVMASVLGVSPSDLAENVDLERLGLDSLMSIEAHHSLCSTFNVQLPEDVFATCKTIKEIHAQLPATETTTTVTVDTQPQSFPAQVATPGVSVEQVKEVMATVLGVSTSDLAENVDLERLGLDSLMSIEAHHSLCSTFNVQLPEDLFLSCKTIRDIHAALPATVTPSYSLSEPSLTPSTRDSDATLQNSAGASDAGAASASLPKIKEIMGAVLDVPVRDLGENQDLERLGMDSLMSIEAHHALCTQLGVTLPEDVFVSCKTISELQAFIAPPPATKAKLAKLDEALAKVASKLQEVDAPVQKVSTFGTEVNPVRLQAGQPGEIPLFLIHDGSGIAHGYGKLSDLRRPVWGIHNPKFSTGEKWEGGLLEMAATYAGMIKKELAGAKATLVGGWSIGGVIAYEVARQLMALGINVPGLVLIDSPHPKTTSALSDDVIKAAFSSRGGSPSRATELARTAIQHATRALVAYDPSQSPAKGFTPPKAVMLRSREGFKIPSVESQSDAFLADRRDPAVMVTEWEEVLGFKVPVVDIPGNHFEPFDAKNVGEVSQRLLDALKLL